MEHENLTINKSNRQGGQEIVISCQKPIQTTKKRHHTPCTAIQTNMLCGQMHRSVANEEQGKLTMGFWCVVVLTQSTLAARKKKCTGLLTDRYPTIRHTNDTATTTTTRTTTTTTTTTNSCRISQQQQQQRINNNNNNISNDEGGSFKHINNNTSSARGKISTQQERHITIRQCDVIRIITSASTGNKDKT